MVTTEQAPPQTSHAEQRVSREKLLQREMQRKVAEVTILAILIASYQNKGHDSLFEKEPVAEQDTKGNAADTKAEVFTLLNHALTPHKAHKRRYYQPHDFSAYRQAVFSPVEAQPQPEFRPAPSLHETALGPQLPHLAFNDRIRPGNTGARSVSDADLAAAGRANEMYQRGLIQTGWQGGEATPDQQKQAQREVVKKYHPDLPTTSEGDAAAIQMMQANNAKPLTPTQSEPAPGAH